MLDDALALLQALRVVLHNQRLEATYDADTLMVARAIEGEGAEAFGLQRDEIARWIAHVAYNRYQQEWWQRIDGVPCTLAERTEHDFHGTANVETPAAWAIEIAYDVLNDRRNQGRDITGGRVFMLSLQDLVDHGWADKAATMQPRKFISQDKPATQMWFLHDWPGPKQ